MSTRARATRIRQQAQESGLVTDQHGAALEQLVLDGLNASLNEARDACININDRAAIDELIAHEPENAELLNCPACDGRGRAHGEPCAVCAGIGQIADPGPPASGPGSIARKPCGCVVGFIADAAFPATRLSQLETWRRLGYTVEMMELEQAMPLIRAGAGCTHRP